MDNQQQTSQTDTSQQDDFFDQEWDDIASDFLESQDGEEPRPEPKEEEKEEEEEGDEADNQQEGGDEEKKDDEKTEGGSEENNTEGEESQSEDNEEQSDSEESSQQKVNPERTQREVRSAYHELNQSREAMKEDVRKNVFGDTSHELKDADGNPIETIQDVMQLENPKTGKAFTSEEAAIWLMQAKQHSEKKAQEIESEVDSIAETNLTLKDQADNILEDYGDLLKTLPDVRDKVWSEYRKTLVYDDKTGVIKKAPVSLESFFRTALEPYVEMVNTMSQQQQQQAQQQKQLEEQQEKRQRKQEQSDRQDIYSGGDGTSLSKDEQEWEQAAREYYET